MHHWIYVAQNHSVETPPISIGIKEKCPFCLARKREIPKIGQRIQFLATSDVGQTGVRVDDTNFQLRSDEFAVKMDYEQRDYTRTVGLYSDLFIVEPIASAPSWTPSLSIEDVLAIHEALLRTLDLNVSENFDKSLFPIVNACWQRRIPVSGKEIWPMLAAHGFKGEEKDFIQLFDYGFQLLIYTQGRPPIKKKRMKPFEKGRYLSANARKFWLERFGHD